MSNGLTKEVVEHQRLIDKVKGFDIENYKVIADRCGVTVVEVLNAVQPPVKSLVLDKKIRGVQERIKQSEHLQLSADYISGLKDALKIMGYKS